MESQNEKSNLDRMKAIFEEREREYQEREAEFKQRRETFHAMEEHLVSEKAQIENREKQLKEQEETLKESLKELQDGQNRLKEETEQLQKEREAFEAERNRSYLQSKLAEEELKNERIKVKRQSEQLEYEKEMGNIGIQIVSPGVDLSDYVLRSVVTEKYILKEEVQKDYILKSMHEEETERLREENKALQKAKTDLFRKMFGKTESEGHSEESVPESGTIEKPEEACQSPEKLRDMTAESLKNELLERTDFHTPQIRHAESGDLVETGKGRFRIIFMFEEIPYFDLVVKEKESRQLNARLTEFIGKHPGITYDFPEDGSLRLNGCFIRTISEETLLSEVESIIAEFEA